MSMEIVYNQPPDELDINSRNLEIRNMLATGVSEVTFTKVDGSVRVMPCTLDPSLMPSTPMVEGKRQPPPPTIINAWCTDKQEWRSFRVANVTRIVRAQ